MTLVMNRYKRNGLLQMLKRNLGVKEAPQRWQDNAADGTFDVVFTFEERVFDTVIDGTSVFISFQNISPTTHLMCLKSYVNMC